LKDGEDEEYDEYEEKDRKYDDDSDEERDESSDDEEEEPEDLLKDFFSAPQNFNGISPFPGMQFQQQPNTIDNTQYEMYQRMMNAPTFGPGAVPLVQHQEPTLQEKANYVKQISDSAFNSNPFGPNPFGPGPTNTGSAPVNIGNPFQNTPNPNPNVPFGNISNPFGGPTTPNNIFSSTPTTGFNSGGYGNPQTFGNTGFAGNSNVFGSSQGFNTNPPSNNMFGGGGAGFGSGFGVGGAGGSGGGISGQMVSYGGNNPNANVNPFTSNTQPSSNPFL